MEWAVTGDMPDMGITVDVALDGGVSLPSTVYPFVGFVFLPRILPVYPHVSCMVVYFQVYRPQTQACGNRSSCIPATDPRMRQ